MLKVSHTYYGESIYGYYAEVNDNNNDVWQNDSHNTRTRHHYRFFSLLGGYKTRVQHFHKKTGVQIKYHSKKVVVDNYADLC